jgi:DMSO reductase family type II enzyme heme b subunit
MNKKVAIIAVCLLALAGCRRGPVVDTQQVSAKLVAGTLPTEDPASRLWNDAPEHPAALMVQDVTEPKLIEPGVPLVKVRALHNREWVVFRLEWEDPTQDLIPESGTSSDAAALQFPMQQGADVPDAAMGEQGKGVRIWYWKAVWQDDDERARAGKGDRIATLYPNAVPDHYPYEANPAARAEMEKRYAPARAAGNPIAARPQAGPVQVLMAEGFGNTTVTPTQQAAGRGRWTDGKWVATIARPLRGGAELGELEAGKKGYLAVAVWDGAKQHTGSRKMRSGWIPFVLKEP